jgi:hypothetical protein
MKTNRAARAAVVATALLATAAASLAVGCSDFAQVQEGEVSVSVERIEFAQTQIGRSLNRQFSIENLGDGDLSIENIEIVNASPYITFSTSFLTLMATENDWRQATGAQTWEQHPAFPLRPSDEIQVDVVFQPISTDLECPNSTGSECGEIVITTNDRERPVVRLPIALNQSSGTILVDPTVLRFPDITGGPYDAEFTITNAGSGPLSGIEVNAPSVAGLTIAENSNRVQPFTLGIGEDSEFTVTFQPDSAVAYCGEEFDPEEGCTLGAITISSDDAQGRVIQITLLVGGVSVPDIDVSTDELVFDAAPGAPDTQTLDVSNTGGANLTWNVRIDPPEVRGAFAVEIDGTAVSASGAQAPALAPSNTATVALTLDPPDESSVRGELVITSLNDPDERVTIIDLFAGEPAPELEVTPTQLFFSGVALGESAELDFVISNPGRGTLNILNAVFSQSTEFSTDPSLVGVTIPAGGQLPVTVTYDRPDDDFAGVDIGVLTISSDALPPNNEFRYNMFAYHEDEALPPVCDIQVTPAEPYAVDTVITLDGTGSEPPEDGELVANPHSWTLSALPEGSGASLSATFGETVTLTPDIAGTYTVLLTVTASIGESAQTQCQLSRNLLVLD